MRGMRMALTVAFVGTIAAIRPSHANQRLLEAPRGAAIGHGTAPTAVAVRGKAPATGRTRKETIAAQNAAANEWWCSEQYDLRRSSLRCKRHALQERHRKASSEHERQALSKELGALLRNAGESALAAMRDEGLTMLRGWCALSSSAGLEICSSHRQKKLRKKTGGGRGGGGGGGHEQNSRARGIAVLWTPESLSLLRTWWCSNRRRMREPRCLRTVRWTRQQPGLSAMRRLFCAQQASASRNATSLLSSERAKRLCHSRAGASTAADTSSAGLSATDFFTLQPKQRGRYVRTSIVYKFVFGLLCMGLVVGWKIRQWWSRKKARARGGELQEKAFDHPVICRMELGSGYEAGRASSPVRRRHSWHLTGKRVKVRVTTSSGSASPATRRDD